MYLQQPYYYYYYYYRKEEIDHVYVARLFLSITNSLVKGENILIS